MEIHTNPLSCGDLDVLYAEMRDAITGVKNTPGTNGAGAFGHIYSSYDASYYGYLWSEVYACDMFEQFCSDVLSKSLGKKYRQIILEKGATEDATDLLFQFLGREPMLDAFLKQLDVDK